MEKVREYQYKPKALVLVLAILIIGGLAAVMAYLALTNDSGLIIEHIIKLSPRSATIFYWCIAGILLAFAAAGLWAFAASLAVEKYIRLTDTELSAPKSGLSKQNTHIPLKEIKKITIQSVQGQRFMTISHSNGKLSIAQSLMPDKEKFEELYRELAERIRQAAGNGSGT